MLTKRQKEIFDYITKCIKENDYAPSLEEIKRYFKLSSVSTIHQHIEAIREKGYLKKIENQPRSIELNPQKNKTNLTEISLLGIISAGGPIEAIKNPEPIDVPQNMLSKNANHYALKVLGTSMIEEGISDGDIIIVREQSTINDGEKAVAYLPDKNTITLKKIYQNKNCVKLVPANKTMKPFYEKNVEIQGKVVGVLREEM